jgi:hypothetical protein
MPRVAPPTRLTAVPRSQATHHVVGAGTGLGARRNGHQPNRTKGGDRQETTGDDAFSLSQGFAVTPLFLLHDHQDSVFARRQPLGMEGRGRVGGKIAVQRSEKFRCFRFFLA